MATYRQNNGGKLPEQEVIRIINQIKQAFEELYQNKIMHRDLKPENILIHDNQIKIADFGFAKFTEDMKACVAMTTLGTPYYSPVYYYLVVIVCKRNLVA